MIEPIFEAELDPEAYGYRPKRSAHDAIRRVHELLCQGYTDVVDADLSKYFDTIPHAELLRCVARRISDRQVLNVIKRWLKTPVEERDENGKRRMTGGKKSMCGTPQGGVMTPRTQKVTWNDRTTRFGVRGWRTAGTRTGLGNRNRVADRDRVTADEDFLYQQTENLLAFCNIEGVSPSAQLDTKPPQRFRQPQVLGTALLPPSPESVTRTRPLAAACG